MELIFIWKRLKTDSNKNTLTLGWRVINDSDI